MRREMLMKGAYHDPVDHARTTQPHAGESFIDTLWLPGLGLIMLGTVTIAGFIAATAYGRVEMQMPLGFIAGALVCFGGIRMADAAPHHGKKSAHKKSSFKKYPAKKYTKKYHGKKSSKKCSSLCFESPSRNACWPAVRWASTALCWRRTQR